MHYSTLLVSVFAAVAAAQSVTVTETFVSVDSTTTTTTPLPTASAPEGTDTALPETATDDVSATGSAVGTPIVVSSASDVATISEAPTVTATTTASLYGNTTTVIVTALTTYCPEPTVLTINGECYTVTAPTTLTFLDCPCTVVSSPSTETPVVVPVGTVGTVTRVPGATVTPYVTVAGAGRLDGERAFVGLVAAAVAAAAFGVAVL